MNEHHRAPATLSRRTRRAPRAAVAVWALACGLLIATDGVAGEGMWLPEQLPTIAKALKDQGLTLPATKLSDLQDGPLAAVIHLGGCTASFVSPDGLIATNHHCAVGAIQHNSTPESNLLEQGFTAKDQADERWAGPGARVFVTLSQEDVTKRFDAALARAAKEHPGDDAAAFRAIDQLEKELIARCEQTANRRCRVPAYDGGARWVLIEQLVLRDVRLVHAPPRAIGVFGGDEDNWMWPRHTGDWSLFRAYTAKDGKSAEFAKDNVPYKPRRWLEVSPQGVAPGDFVAVTGYPGRTSRYKTADELRYAAQTHYPWTLGILDDLVALLEAQQKRSPEAKVKLTGVRAGLANYQKYLRGLLDGFKGAGAVALRGAQETALRTWIAADAGRAKRYGGPTSELDKRIGAMQRDTRRFAVMRWMLRLPVLVRTAATVHWLGRQRLIKDDKERDAGYQARDWPRLKGALMQRHKSYVPAADKALLERTLVEAARLPKDARILGVDRFLARYAEADDTSEQVGAMPDGAPIRRAQVQRAVAWLYADTRLAEAAFVAEAFEQDAEALKKHGERLIAFASSLFEERKEMKDKLEAHDGALARLRPVYMAALRERHRDAARADRRGDAWRLFKGEMYADANSTLRVTFGQVRGYSPREAVQHTPLTSLRGVLEKDRGAEPFDVPAAQRAAIERLHGARDGTSPPYVDATLASVPVNFLSTCDTTGGNSGSPTIDAQGRFVGLLFDGNYEAMGSDWLFDPVKTRSIHVDVRYMLWSLENVLGGARLVREMGIDAEGKRARR